MNYFLTVTEGAGVPAKYSDEDTTPLQAEVKGGEVAFDVNLDP